MAGGYEPGGEAPAAQDAAGPVAQDLAGPVAQDLAGPVAQDPGVASAAEDTVGELDAETIELIAQIRQLAADDPYGVQQIIAEVLDALDRVTGNTPQER